MLNVSEILNCFQELKSTIKRFKLLVLQFDPVSSYSFCFIMRFRLFAKPLVIGLFFSCFVIWVYLSDAQKNNKRMRVKLRHWVVWFCFLQQLATRKLFENCEAVFYFQALFKFTKSTLIFGTYTFQVNTFRYLWENVFLKDVIL